MKHTISLIMLAVASLAACGKSAEAPAPVAPATEEAAPQTGRVPLTAAEPLAPPPASSTASLPEMPPAAVPRPAETQAAPAAKTSGEPASGTAKLELAHGQQIYRQACAFCHDKGKGVAGAPKAGDTAAWSPRLAQGMDALYAAALRGKGAMPAKGGNPALASNDIRAAVDYLVAQSR